MSQRKKIALAYLVAVPIALLIVLIQRVSLMGANASNGQMKDTADAIRLSDMVPELLKEAETNAQAFLAPQGNSASLMAYRDSVDQLHATLQEVGEKTRDDRTIQADLQTVGDLIAKRLAMFNQEMASKQDKAATHPKSTASAPGPNPSEEINKVMVKISTVERTRLQQLGESSKSSLDRANLIATYGGGIMIWLVGVAAFLLFHEEKTKAWAGVERRVHTKILQTLPLGVSVATETGIIIYTNPAEDNLLGYNSGELMGNNANVLHDLEGPEGEPTVKAILERLNAGEFWTGDLPVRTKDGAIRKVASWVMNLDIPGKVYRVFMHRGA